MDVKKRLCLLIFVLAGIAGVRAQHVGIKTNLVDDALMDVNLGIEVGLAPRWTLDIPVSYNNWILSHGRRWKHLVAQPGVRYWFCDRFGGSFIGIHTHGGQYNVGSVSGLAKFLGWDGDGKSIGSDLTKTQSTRYQGWFVGGGVSFGHAWVLGTHWNLEAEIGVGYAYTRYDQFQCTGCGKKLAEDQPHHYVGPTKAAVNLVYLF